jgi:Fic family protein
MSWVNARLGLQHPVIIAAVAHYNFARIHPFDDGNGRGARFLMNLIFMKRGLPPAVISNADRQDYIEAQTAADRGQPSPFVAFIAQATRITLETLVSDFKTKP